MAKILLGMIKSRQVQFHSIAVEIRSDAKKASIERSIQAFFKRFDFDFDFEKAGLAFLSFLPPGKLDLSIGSGILASANVIFYILMISVSFEGIGIHLINRARVIRRTVATRSKR